MGKTERRMIFFEDWKAAVRGCGDPGIRDVVVGWLFQCEQPVVWGFVKSDGWC